jgi:hypothetical protein
MFLSRWQRILLEGANDRNWRGPMAEWKASGEKGLFKPGEIKNTIQKS